VDEEWPNQNPSGAVAAMEAAALDLAENTSASFDERREGVALHGVVQLMFSNASCSMFSNYTRLNQAIHL
jgi:hypothetical protein